MLIFLSNPVFPPSTQGSIALLSHLNRKTRDRLPANLFQLPYPAQQSRTMPTRPPKPSSLPMAATRSLYKPPLPRATSYSHLYLEDIAALTSILSHHPPPHVDHAGVQCSSYRSITKQQIAALRPHLQSSLAHTLTGALKPAHAPAARGRLGELCPQLHGRLSARLCQSVFEWVRHEFETGIPMMLAPLWYHDMLSAAQEQRLRCLEPVVQMWKEGFDPVAEAVPGREPRRVLIGPWTRSRVSKWGRQEDGCFACMLARIGGDENACFALLTGMVARMKSERIKDGKSGRVQWVEAWLKGFQGSERLIQEAWALGNEIKEMSRKIRGQIHRGEILDPSVNLAGTRYSKVERPHAVDASEPWDPHAGLGPRTSPKFPGSPKPGSGSPTTDSSDSWNSLPQQVDDRPPLWSVGASSSRTGSNPSQNPYSLSISTVNVQPANPARSRDWDSKTANTTSRSNLNASKVSLAASSIYSQPTNAASTYTNPSSLDEYARVSIRNIPSLPPLFARHEWVAYQEAVEKAKGNWKGKGKAEGRALDYGNTQSKVPRYAGLQRQPTIIPSMRNPGQPNPFTQNQPRAPERSAKVRHRSISPLISDSRPVVSRSDNGYVDVSPVNSEFEDVGDWSSMATRWSDF